MFFFRCYINFRGFAAVRFYDQFSLLKIPDCTKIKARLLDFTRIRKYNYFVRGSIIPFLATWHEQSERNKIFFFFNLENSNKKKSCVRKLLKSDGEETTDANVILNEIYIFYSDLYDKKPEIQNDFTGCSSEVNS